jgi:hypothetical protein
MDPRLPALSDLDDRLRVVRTGAELVALCAEDGPLTATERWNAVAPSVPSERLADQVVARAILKTGLVCWSRYLARPDCPATLRQAMLAETIRMIGSQLTDSQVLVSSAIVRSAIRAGHMPLGSPLERSLADVIEQLPMRIHSGYRARRAAIALRLAYEDLPVADLLRYADDRPESGADVVAHPKATREVWRRVAAHPLIAEDTVVAFVSASTPLDDPEVWTNLAGIGTSDPARGLLCKSVAEHRTRILAAHEPLWFPRYLRLAPSPALHEWRAAPARFSALRAAHLIGALTDPSPDVREAALAVCAMLGRDDATPAPLPRGRRPR